MKIYKEYAENDRLFRENNNICSNEKLLISFREEP